MQPAVEMTSEKFLDFLLSPIGHSNEPYQRDETNFKVHKCTIHAMVHVFDPSSPFVLEYLKANQDSTGLTPSGFDLEELIASAKDTCQRIIEEFFTTSGSTVFDDAPHNETVLEALEPAPAPFCSVYAFYNPPEPLKVPPPRDLMLLAADDSHTGRVLRNHELEQLGLGTLRVLMDVLWFERSPVKLSEATVGKGGRKADDCVDVPPGHLKLDSSEDGKEDLESAVKLNSWLDSHCKSPQSMKSSANGSSGLDIGSLTLADHQRKLEHVATEASDKIVTSSSSTLKGGNLQYNFHGGVPVSIKPPGYARERLLRHTIASRLTGLPYVSHPLIVQVLIESDANLPD